MASGFDASGNDFSFVLMSAKLVSITMLLLLPALAEAQPSARCSGPLSEEQLTTLVKGSVVPDAPIKQNVTSCGIDFEATAEAIARLRSAGASESVLAAVRAATGPAERKRRAEQALWESIKDSRDPAVFADYLRRYPDGQFAATTRQKYRDLKVASIRAEMERALAAGQWDAADREIRDLLRSVSETDEIKGWERRVADGRSAAQRKTPTEDVISGEWLYEYVSSRGGGQYQVWLDLKADGENLTGTRRTSSGSMSPEPVQGKVSSTGSSFEMTESPSGLVPQRLQQYKGAISGDELALTYINPNGHDSVAIYKRVKPDASRPLPSARTAIDGEWVREYGSRGGPAQESFLLKTEGSKLNITLTRRILSNNSPPSQYTISGLVQGSNLSFDWSGAKFEGVVSGDSLTITVINSNGRSVFGVYRRAK
jgi:hypothetical protein